MRNYNKKNYNRINYNSKSKPITEKSKSCKNPDFLAGWDWLFGTYLISDVREGHKYTKSKKSIYGVLHFCKTCNKVWEVDRESYRDGRVQHYDNFPTFGLKRKKYPHCKGGKNGSNFQDTNTKPNK